MGSIDQFSSKAKWKKANLTSKETDEVIERYLEELQAHQEMKLLSQKLQCVETSKAAALHTKNEIFARLSKLENEEQYQGFVIPKAYQCVVCTHVLSPVGIVMCEQGHNMCSLCMAKSGCCPECPKTVKTVFVRNYALEVKVRKTVAKCPCAIHGCQQVIPIARLRMHILLCAFKLSKEEEIQKVKKEYFRTLKQFDMLETEYQEINLRMENLQQLLNKTDKTPLKYNYASMKDLNNLVRIQTENDLLTSAGTLEYLHFLWHRSGCFVRKRNEEQIYASLTVFINKFQNLKDFLKASDNQELLEKSKTAQDIADILKQQLHEYYEKQKLKMFTNQFLVRARCCTRLQNKLEKIDLARAQLTTMKESRKSLLREVSAGSLPQIGNCFDFSGIIEPEFLCTICFEVFPYKILMCTLGHNICFSCFQILPELEGQGKLCCECRTPYSIGTGYNRALESIISKQTVKCPFDKNGCDENVGLRKLEKHVGCCQFKNMRPVQLVKLEQEIQEKRNEIKKLQDEVEATVAEMEGIEENHTQNLLPSKFEEPFQQTYQNVWIN